MYASTAVNNDNAGICKPGLRCQQNLDFCSNRISVVDIFQVVISPHLLKWLLQQKDLFLLYINSLNMLPNV